jgi:hypothetical protein
MKSENSTCPLTPYNTHNHYKSIYRRLRIIYGSFFLSASDKAPYPGWIKIIFSIASYCSQTIVHVMTSTT